MQNEKGDLQKHTCWGTPRGEAVMYETTNSKLAKGSSAKDKPSSKQMLITKTAEKL